MFEQPPQSGYLRGLVGEIRSVTTENGPGVQFSFEAPETNGNIDGCRLTLLRNMRRALAKAAGLEERDMLGVVIGGLIESASPPAFNVTLGGQAYGAFQLLYQQCLLPNEKDDPERRFVSLADRRVHSLKLIDFRRVQTADGAPAIEADFAAPMVHYYKDSGDARLSRVLGAALYEVSGKHLLTEPGDFSVERVEGIKPSGAPEITYKVTITDPAVIEAFAAWASKHKQPGQELALSDVLPAERAL